MLLSLNRNPCVGSRQLGFRHNTNCQTAIFAVQEIIHSYTRENSRVHCSLIDLAKSFGQIIFDILITKPQKMQVPPLITKLLCFMFNSSFVKVYFNGEIGDDWNIGNGARQGDFLSQILFNFFFN